MKKNFILDDGKIRNCQTNIAMMNIFQYVIFDIFNRKCLKHMFTQILNQYLDGFKFLYFAVINTILLIIFPISFLLKGYFEIKDAKIQVKKYSKRYKQETV